MKIYLILILILSLFMLLFPLAMSAENSGQTEELTSVSLTAQESSAESTSGTKSNEENDSGTIKVLRTASGRVVDVELYDYVVGCVASEMPAYYEKEALKAQAVVCYTYAKWITQNSDSGIESADVTDSASKHQKYMDEDELKKKFGEKYDGYIERIKECVNEVMGEYLSYDNEPIMACYHALSSGQTQSAKTVWGDDIPYLQSVSAPGDELSPDFDKTVSLTEAQFKEKVKEAGVTELSKKQSEWFKITEKNKSGYVIEAEIGGKTFSGAEVRNIFSLESAVFTFEYTNEKFVFKTKGKGHQIGMSQYCADYMARQGKTYKEILSHFYPGTVLTGSGI
ncbi:MAG: stage II sporulation protein D [Acutalibacteraceae bacterium]